MRGDKQYGIPFAWGSLPLVYDTTAFPTAPDSWDRDVGPAVCPADDRRSTTPTTPSCWRRSSSASPNPYNLTDDEFEQVKEKLIEQKKLLLTYYAGFDDGVKLFAQNGLKLMFSMGEPQVAGTEGKGVDAALSIPKEKAIGWLDCWD